MSQWGETISEGASLFSSTRFFHETDGLILQDRDSMPNWYTINHPTTLHTHMKPSNPLLLADGALHCGMYPAGKVAISNT